MLNRTTPNEPLPVNRPNGRESKRHGLPPSRRAPAPSALRDSTQNAQPRDASLQMTGKRFALIPQALQSFLRMKTVPRLNVLVGQLHSQVKRPKKFLPRIRSSPDSDIGLRC